jgi:hypothetical protein
MVGDKALSELRQVVSHLVAVLEANSDEEPLLGTTRLITDIARKAREAGVTPPVSRKHEGSDSSIVATVPTGDNIIRWPCGLPYRFRLGRRRYLDHQRKIRTSLLCYLRLWKVWFDNNHGRGPAAPARKHGGGGRNKDPKVQARNKKIAADFQKGLDVGAVCEKYDISAPLARHLKSDLGKGDKTAEDRQS